MPLPILEVTDLEGDSSSVVIIDNVTAPLVNDSPTFHIINFINGWNMFSSYIDTTQLTNWDFDTYPPDQDVTSEERFKMGEIFQQFLYVLSEDGVEYNLYDANPTLYNSVVVLVKDNLGIAYLPEWNFDGIKSWKEPPIDGHFRGFQCKINGDGYYLKLQGVPAPVQGIDIDFPLLNGWNIIGYPFVEPISAVDFFENLLYLDALIIAKDYIGNAYLPEWNFNGLGNMVPGQGYQIKTQNWTNYDSFSARVGSGNIIIDTGGVVEEETNPHVDVVDDTVLVTDTNMTVRIPSNLIEPLIEYFDIKIVLDKKIPIMLNYFGGKNAPHATLNMIDEKEKKIIEINETQEKKEDIVQKNNLVNEQFSSDFDRILFNLILNFEVKNEPSGYSAEVQTYIRNTWSDIRLKEISKESLRNLLYNELYKDKLSFTIYAYSSNKQIVVGALKININTGFFPESGYLFQLSGNDSTTANTVEGLNANEIPVFYFFNGEKYNLCIVGVDSNYNTIGYGDKKDVVFSSLTLQQPPVNKPS
tara:strand:- start:2248 stop:3834 length:1587 start_codon:yes stop_codon:yes gene_type:complete